MNIKKIEDERLAALIADIHVRTFKGFFLTFLGKGFLTEMYKGFITHETSGVLGVFCSENNMDTNKLELNESYSSSVRYNDNLVGFLAFSENISDFYKYLIKKKLVTFAWYSLLATLKNPKIVFRLLRAFIYPKESKSKENFIELASIGVAPTSENKGIGSLLINALKGHFDTDKINDCATNQSKYKYIRLETDKRNNDAVNTFYLKHGFVLNSSYIRKEGREMNEYRYYLK